MQGDFFQVLRKVQKEERNKSSLSRVENDFYKQLRDYIKNLEHSVANDPFGNEQLLLNNAQRIATEICELRESKITKAANNNIYRSFLLFKKDNPQFDLLDTTPLNLTDEEETLYFSLMDSLKNHRYRISLDEYSEEGTIEDDFEEKDHDEEGTFVEDSYGESKKPKVLKSSNSNISDDLEISNALGESNQEDTSSIQEEVSTSFNSSNDLEVGNSDEVLSRLNQIKDAKVVTDEKYEPIDKQVANQKYPSQKTDINQESNPQVDDQDVQDSSPQVDDQDVQDSSPQVDAQDVQESSFKAETQENIKPKSEESSKQDGFISNNVDDIFKNPDSQFVDLDKLEQNYNEDYYNSIVAESNYASPDDDDFNMIFAKPKKPKSNQIKSDEAKKLNDNIKDKSDDKAESTQSDLGFSSGLDVKDGKLSQTDGFNKAMESTKKETPKKVVDKTMGGLFAKEEIENTTVIISENIDEIVGIDEKVYGPFLANDVVILPNITAQILIDNNKAVLVKH
ncbi:DNA replication complex subunit Gins51 [Methanobrevibacter olleyae]|uniref:Gins51 C-terminal domain-containing protein n=1 Tax=Methanobrevibacter olleyae TaxID=294671 RepID=A0A126R1W3_METOL|nr:hypothetical protein [Methanobrevibacter olleyae]AMK16062.1 hypothetical protein YLM1_1505 [Methanobrevibacter olleyae]